MTEKLIFEKVVDKSALSEGITVPLAYQEILYSHINHRLQHGESIPLQIQMNGMNYSVQLKNLAFDKQKYRHHDIVQIRYSRNGSMATALRTVFNRTNEKVEQLLSPASTKASMEIPAKEQEYIMVYAVPGQQGLLFETVTVGDISQEMDQLAGMPEQMIEEVLSADETAGMDVRLRVARIRRMNHAIGDSLKNLYGYRCQICGSFIGESYGSQVIHAHHIDYFSRSMNNDASNIMIVCPNHHAIIHDRNPEFNNKEKTYRYPNGFVEGLALNRHL